MDRAVKDGNSGHGRILMYMSGISDEAELVPAANLGPFPPVLAAGWMTSTLDGKRFPSEKWHVGATGRVVRTPM